MSGFDISILDMSNEHFSLQRCNGDECKLYCGHDVLEDLTWEQVQTLPALIEHHRRIWDGEAVADDSGEQDGTG